MLTTPKLSTHSDSDFEDRTLYRSIVGGLQYATITRLDISHSVNKVSQYMHKPLQVHCKAIKRILRYLSGTSDQGLVLYKCKDLRLLAFSGSD